MSVSLNTSAPVQTLSQPANDPGVGHAAGRPGRPHGAGRSGEAKTAAASSSNITLSTPTPPASGQSAVAGVQPDIDGDGARLLALQVQQSLGAQPTSIANGVSQSILSLFKA